MNVCSGNTEFRLSLLLGVLLSLRRGNRKVLRVVVKANSAPISDTLYESKDLLGCMMSRESSLEYILAVYYE